MPRLRKYVLAGSLALPLVIGGWVAQERSTRDGARLFDQVLSLVSSRFVDTLDQAALYERAARGLVQQLNDPYSEFYTPKQRQRFSTTSTGRYGGLGMSIEKQDEYVVVVKVFHNTPAERGGVQEGDRIIGIDTASTRGWSSTQVSDVLVGTIGTKVSVRFARPGVGAAIEQRFTRAEIRAPAIPVAVMLDPKIGYVQLQSFNEASSHELESTVRSFMKQGATGAIIDLRSNPGGILEQSLAIADLFLKRGQQIASVRARTGQTQDFQAEGRARIPDLPLIVLTDQWSASASEIVAGALQDHDRALVVGTTTFGKGLVQTVFPLEGGYALKLTTAKWYTPSGRSIQKDRKQGVDPANMSRAAIDAIPDSLETDSVKKNRPAFRSDAGRTVYGGGGITPDIIIPEDTLSTVEQEFARSLAAKQGVLRSTIYNLAFELKGNATKGFTVKPEWREEFYRRLAAANVQVDRKQFDASTATVDRWLGQQIARLAHGDSAAFRRAIPDDSQLAKAIDLLRRGQTQKDLFVLAQSTAKP